MKKYLIINADDFGLHSDINRSIQLMFEKKIVRSVSFITNTDLFEDSLNIIRQFPDVSVGVHLNLTDGRPISSGRSLGLLLNKEGNFLGDHLQVLRSVFLHFLKLEDLIKTEFECQIERLLAKNIKISHLDSHGHIHMLPPLFKIILKAAGKFKIPFVRIPAEPIFFQGCIPRWDIVSLNILSKCAKFNLRGKNVRYADYFFGSRYAGKFTKDTMIRFVKQLKPGVAEIAVHLGCDNQDISKQFKWGYSWSDELKALADNDTMETIKLMDVNLINFNDILKNTA
jgi:predicted glycoside hydrolase/deacetylase ChbG (UPF0249 family)